MPAPPAKPRRLTADARRDLIERAATEVFAERGYRGAAMDVIARRSGITVPVLYDHFPSKRDLHRRLLERHFGELQALWARELRADEPPELRVPRAIDAWFAYVQAHPYAARMLFRETTGDPQIEEIHREVAAWSRDALLPLVARELGPAAPSPVALAMLWELIRGGMQSLAMWWHEHPEVPREHVVAAVMNTLFVGLERVRDGELWTP